MDIERIKKSFKWDPSEGDYSKSHVSYERKLNKRKQTRAFLLKILYILILIVSIILIYRKFK